jgi:hypothetical protein
MSIVSGKGETRPMARAVAGTSAAGWWLPSA